MASQYALMGRGRDGFWRSCVCVCVVNQRQKIVLIGCFDPNTKVMREDSIELTISVLSGRHLHRD